MMNESSSSDEIDVASDGGEPSDGADNDTDNSDSISMNDDSDTTTTPSPSLECNYQYVPTPQSFSTEQLERIAVIEAAASNVHAVLVKYGNAASLPPSLDPNDIIDGKLKYGWEIDPNTPWADTSSAINEIVSAGERLVQAWSRDDAENVDMTQKDDGASMKVPQKKQDWWESILSTDPTQQNNSNESSSESMRRNGDDDAATNVPPKSDEQPLTEEEQHQFHNVYMEWVTNAFEEELDALRKGQLEEFTASRSKNMKSAKSSTTGGGSSSNNNSGGAAMGENETVELDPTQYSFVVAGGNTKDDNKRKGLDTKVDVAAAEAARMEAVQEIDIRVLSDMLYSGSNNLTTSEKRMLLQARQRALLKDTVVMEDDTTDDAGLTLHERRKREIGLC